MVDQGRPVMRLTIEILQKKPKESNYHTLLNRGQFATCGFTHWWWSNGQKNMMFSGGCAQTLSRAFAQVVHLPVGFQIPQCHLPFPSSRKTPTINSHLEQPSRTGRLSISPSSREITLPSRKQQKRAAPPCPCPRSGPLLANVRAASFFGSSTTTLPPTAPLAAASQLADPSHREVAVNIEQPSGTTY